MFFFASLRKLQSQAAGTRIANHITRNAYIMSLRFLQFASLVIIFVKKFQTLFDVLVPIFLLFHTRARKKAQKK